MNTRRREIIGYGRFIGTTIHSARDVWDLLHFANGAWSLDAFLAQVANRCEDAPHDVDLANALLVDVLLFPPLNPFDLPDIFPADSRTPLCSAWSPNGRILVRSLRHHAGRSLVFGHSPQARLLGYRTYRIPGTLVRVDDRVLRSLLAEWSGHRCAISEGRVAASVHVAHARPLQYGGPDDLGNLFLLGVRPHALWDDGLIGVDKAHRIMVSQQLRLLEPNSDLLRRAGQPLRRRKSGNPYPDEANLRWHRDHRFKWPAYEP